MIPGTNGNNGGFGFVILLVLLSTVHANFLYDQEGDDWDDDNNGIIPGGTEFCGPTKEASVVIVGAGLAGLAAAAVLENKDISYYLVEARKEVGGRLHSVTGDFEDASGNNITIEYGPNWMLGLGEKHRLNPMYGLLNEYGVDFYNQTYDFSTYTFKPKGALYDSARVAKKVERYNKKRERCLDVEGDKWFRRWKNGRKQTPDSTSFEIMSACGWKSGTKLKDAIRHLYHDQEYGVGFSDTGKASYPEDSINDFGSGSYFIMDQASGGAKGGWQKVAFEFADRNVDETRINLKSTVTMIRYDSSKLAKVAALREEDDGSICLQKYSANYVITTMPQNVLMEDQSTVFNPPLDINDHPIYLNHIEKVWFQFNLTEPAFWDTSEQWIIIANKQQNGQATAFMSYDYKNGTKSLLPGSRLLLTLVIKDQIDQLPGGVLNEETARKNVLQSLRGLGLPGFTEPTKVKITNWKGDPFARGSWETWKLNSTYSQYEKSIQPRERLHLAGSAHCNRYWGFTWGAWLSGIWNAECIYNRLEGNETAIPYSPCTDQNLITGSEWRRFYNKNDFFKRPLYPNGPPQH